VHPSAPSRPAVLQRRSRTTEQRHAHCENAIVAALRSSVREGTPAGGFGVLGRERDGLIGAAAVRILCGKQPMRFVAERPFELAVISTPFNAVWRAAGYCVPGFADGHIPHGWACIKARATTDWFAPLARGWSVQAMAVAKRRQRRRRPQGPYRSRLLATTADRAWSTTKIRRLTRELLGRQRDRAPQRRVRHHECGCIDIYREVEFARLLTILGFLRGDRS
jgi:hypothetical protein